MGRTGLPVMTGYPVMAAGPAVNPFVGSKIASRLNCFNVPSIPLARPRSSSAARAAKYASSTVEFSEAMNLRD